MQSNPTSQISRHNKMMSLFSRRHMSDASSMFLSLMVGYIWHIMSLWGAQSVYNYSAVLEYYYSCFRSCNWSSAGGVCQWLLLHQRTNHGIFLIWGSWPVAAMLGAVQFLFACHTLKIITHTNTHIHTYTQSKSDDFLTMWERRFTDHQPPLRIKICLNKTKQKTF